MKRIHVLALLFVTSISGFAVEPQEILGKWNFSHVEGQEELSEKEATMIHMMFDGMYFKFNEDRSYEFFGMGKLEKGSYVLNKKGNVIEVTDDKDRKNELEILDYSPDKMKVQLRNLVMYLVLETPGSE